MNFIRTGLAVAAMLLLQACDTSYPTAEVPEIASMAEEPDLYKPTLEAEYRIGSGDNISIDSFYQPTLKQSVIVQQDGRISVILLGEVVAAGKTTGELSQELIRAYSVRLNVVDLTVGVREIANDTVYVGGQVQTPSKISARGELTLLQGIFAAGGFTTAANTKQVLILRARQQQGYRVLQQNADAVLHNQAGELYLHRHDIVYVPMTEIAHADKFVEQYINSIIPSNFSAGVGYSIYNENP